MIKARGEFVNVTEQINLTVQLKDSTGTPINVDFFPQISLINPSGTVGLAYTSVGVTQIGVGNYSYILTIPYNGPYGVWADYWKATIGGNVYEQGFQFIVSGTQMPGINSDGYMKLGDDPGFSYSQEAIRNINFMIKMMKQRLNSSGKTKATDSYGNVIYIDCDIYSIEMLTTFLAMALSHFNSIPFFTSFQFDDDGFVAQFGEIIVQGAVLYALSSMALIERGREFQITDNSLSFQPPTVSEMLNTQYTSMLTVYTETLKNIKNSLRPSALGLGTFTFSNNNPTVRNMRLLRERRIM
jgi:hypothetical protein